MDGLAVSGKNAKTMLFALLIVVFRIPTSRIHSVSAEKHGNESTDTQKIQRAIQDYEDALETAETDEELKDIQEGLGRLILARQILQQIEKANSVGSLTRAQPSVERGNELLDELDATYDGKDSTTTSNTANSPTKSSVNVNLTTGHEQSAVGCSAGERVIGEAVTNFKPYTNGYATIRTSFDYPDTFSERDFPWSDCVTFDHERTTERHYVITSWFPGADPGSGQPCHTEVYVAVCSDNTLCYRLGPGMATLIVLGNEYEDNTNVQLGWINGGLLRS